jgi:hypothetical protein
MVEGSMTPALPPWFDVSSPYFDPGKLTREPNKCFRCNEPMTDVGSQQIIYECHNVHCDSYDTKHLDPLTGLPGYDPFITHTAYRRMQ